MISSPFAPGVPSGLPVAKNKYQVGSPARSRRSSVTRMLVFCVAALSLGVFSGARILPAALSPSAPIPPEGEHGITHFGPFVAGAIEATTAIAVGTEGELKLSFTGGQ